jgi:hypothetical protein
MRKFLSASSPVAAGNKTTTATPVSSKQKGVSYAEAKAQRESRLAEIFALPLHEFEETRKQLVHEAKSLRPRAGSWVHKEALVLCAKDGVVYEGKKWGVDKTALAWSFVVDVSASSGCEHDVVYLGDFTKVTLLC